MGAIKNQLESSGNAFVSAEHLINAAFSVQREQERRSRLENLSPSGATLTGFGEGEGRSRRDRVELSNLLGEERMEVEEEAGSTVSLTPRSPTTSTITSPTTTTPAPAVQALATPGSSIASSNQQHQQEQELASI